MKKAPARATRVRLGFHRQRRITNVERAMEVNRKKTEMGAHMDGETKKVARDAMKALEETLLKLLPKRVERRGVR